MVNWLFLDLNSYFASCEQQVDPKLRGRPIIIVPTEADNTSCIAASYEAKRFGIKTGTRVGDAKKMCRGLVLVQAHHSRYVEFHHKIVETVESCVPVHSVCSIDEMACELTGSQQKVENAVRLAKQIKLKIKNEVGECLTSSIGLAPNSLLAKMASDMQKPDGLTIIRKTDLPTLLYKLKLNDIPGVGRQMEARLNNAGIYTMEELLSLSEQQMRAIWGGIVGARFFHMLRGQHIELAKGETKSISHSHVMPPDLRNFNGAKIVAHKLISKAAVRLRREGFMTRRMSIYIKYYNEQKWEQSFKFHETQDTSFFLEKFNQAYQHSPKQNKPLKVVIWFSDFVKENEYQLSFFENDRRNMAFKAVDALNEKYGRNTVFVGTLQNNLDSAPTRIAFSQIPDLEDI